LCMTQLTDSKALQQELTEKGFQQAQAFCWKNYARELEEQLELLLMQPTK